jgi:hypothetical protein
MTGKPLSALYEMGNASVPDAMAPHVGASINQRIYNAINVEMCLSPTWERYLSEHVGPQLNYTKVKMHPRAPQLVSQMLARQQAYKLVGLEPVNAALKILIVGPTDSEVSRFSAYKNVDFLPFIHGTAQASANDTLLAKAFSRAGQSVSANVKDWASYRYVNSLVKDRAGSFFAYLGVHQYLEEYLKTIQQDLNMTLKVYDACLVSEGCAAHMPPAAWQALTRFVAGDIYWYSPWVPDVLFGMLSPNECYDYSQISQKVGDSALSESTNPATVQRDNLFVTTTPPERSLVSTIKDLLFGNAEDVLSVLSWRGELGIVPGSQFVAKRCTWILLSGLTAIVAPSHEHTDLCHMLPYIEYDNGTYVVGKWQLVREQFLIVRKKELHPSRVTVRIPAFSKLYNRWSHMLTRADIDEAKSRSVFDAIASTPAFSYLIPLEFFDNLALYAQRVADKTRDTKDFISSVVGFGNKMLGAQSMVGSLAISTKTYNVPARNLLDIAYAVHQHVTKQLERMRNVSSSSGIWAKIKLAVVEALSDTWITDFLVWLYGERDWMQVMPNVLETQSYGAALSIRIRTGPMPKERPKVFIPKDVSDVCVSTSSTLVASTNEESDTGPSEDAGSDSESEESEASESHTETEQLVNNRKSSQKHSSREFELDGEDEISESEILANVASGEKVISSTDTSGANWFTWECGNLPSVKTDRNDPSSPLVREPGEKLAAWTTQVLAKIPARSEWHLADHSGDPLLDDIRTGVDQVVLTKHSEYHATPFEFTMTAAQIRAVGDRLKEDFGGPIPAFDSEEYKTMGGLQKLQVFWIEYCRRNRKDLKYTVPEVFILEGGPGCGKSHTARSIMFQETVRAYNRNKTSPVFNVIVPMQALMTDFGHIYTTDPDGSQVTGTVEVRTHQKVFDFRQQDYLFADEVFTLGSEWLMFALMYSQPKRLYLLGDSLQNKLAPDYGIHPFAAWPKLINCNRYRMAVNFRNPKAHVVHLSREYCEKHGLAMVPGGENIGKIFIGTKPSDFKKLEDDTNALPTIDPENGKKIEWTSFTHNDGHFMSHYFPQKQKKKNGKFETATSLQGKTFDNVGIIFTGSARSLLAVSAQPYVAFSRHRYNLYIINPSSDMLGVMSNIQRTLNPYDVSPTAAAEFVANTAAGFVDPSAKNEAIVLEPNPPAAPVEIRPFYDAHAAAARAVDPDVFHVSEVRASLPCDPTDAGNEYKLPYALRTPYNVMFGAGGKIQPDFVPVLCAGDPHAPLLSQTNGAHQIARTAVGRYTKPPKVSMDATRAMFVDRLVRGYVADCKSALKLQHLRNDPDVWNHVYDSWLQDARKRNYWARMFGSWDGKFDAHLGMASDKGAMLLEKFSVHLAQKAQIKAVNVQKGYDMGKMGQPLSAVNLKVIFKIALLCRYLSMLDMLSGTDGNFCTIEHNGRTPEAVHEDINKFIGVASGWGIPIEIANLDIAESDIMVNAVALRIVTELISWLAPPDIDPAVWHEYFTLYATRQRMDSGHVVIEQMFQNLTGHPFTLFVITVIQKVIGHYIVPTRVGKFAQVFRAESNIGDDAAIISHGMTQPEWRYEHQKRCVEVYTKVGLAFKITICKEGDYCEFVGHVMAIDGGKMTFAPSLTRRVKRFLAMAWPENKEIAEKRFYAVQNSIRDYFAAYEKIKDEIIVADALLNMEDQPDDKTREEWLAYCVKDAEFKWQVWKSLSHVSWLQFEKLLKPTTRWVNVRTVVHNGLTNLI